MPDFDGKKDDKNPEPAEVGWEAVVFEEEAPADLVGEDAKNDGPPEPAEADEDGGEEPTEDNPSATRRDVFVMDGCYYKYTGGRNPQLRQVSNFTLQAQAKVVFNGNWSYRCTAKRSTSEEYEVELFRDDFLSGGALKGALSSISELEYYGVSCDTTQIQGILADQMPPVIRGTDTNGMHIVNDRLVYVEGEQVVDEYGPSADIVYMNKSAQAHRMPCLLDQPDLSNDDLQAITHDLYQFNDDTDTFPILGFIGYCFAKEALAGKVNRHNPFLFCQGEPGAGKSQTISRIIQPILGSQQPLTNIGSMTEFALAVNSGTSNITPACYDEYKQAVLTKGQRRVIDNALLATYAQSPLERGRMNMTVSNYPFTAPLVMAGEMTIDSASQKHRIIEVYFSYSKRAGHEENYRRLIEQPLGAFGKALLLHTLQLGPGRIRTEYDRQEIMVDETINDRLRENAALMRTGLWLITDFFQANGIGVDCYNQGYDIIDSVIQESIDASKITNVDKTISDFCAMAHDGRLQSGVDYEVKDEILRLKISPVYLKYQRWVKRNGISEYIGKTSFLQQLKEKEYLLPKKSIRIGGKTCNGIELDLSLMPKGIDADWPGYEPSQETDGFFDEEDSDAGDDDEAWYKGIPEYEMSYEEFCNHISDQPIYNKDGKMTLTSHLMQILYCDKQMELEVVLDKLWERGVSYDAKYEERIVRMTLRRSEHFAGSDETGYLCPGNGRFWNRFN